MVTGALHGTAYRSRHLDKGSQERSKPVLVGGDGELGRGPGHGARPLGYDAGLDRARSPPSRTRLNRRLQYRPSSQYWPRSGRRCACTTGNRHRGCPSRARGDRRGGASRRHGPSPPTSAHSGGPGSCHRQILRAWVYSLLSSSGRIGCMAAQLTTQECTARIRENLRDDRDRGNRRWRPYSRMARIEALQEAGEPWAQIDE